MGTLTSRFLRPQPPPQPPPHPPPHGGGGGLNDGGKISEGIIRQLTVVERTRLRTLRRTLRPMTSVVV